MRTVIAFRMVASLACQPRPEFPRETPPQYTRNQAFADSLGPDLEPVEPYFEDATPTPELRTSEMIEVPAGMAVLGSTSEDLDHAVELCRAESDSAIYTCDTQDFERESPRREVDLEAFWIDTSEVTVQDYQQCIEAGICTPPNASGVCKENTYIRALSTHPVNCVDWREASAYCRWRGKRLPNADEWEKAARGTEGETFPWGEEAPTCEHAYTPYRGGCGDWATLDGGTAPVGSVPLDRSPYGVKDMAGNVGEWTSSEYHGFRITKGGGAYSRSSNLRCAAFSAVSDDDVEIFVGFRCAYSEEEDEPGAAEPPQIEFDAL